MRRLGAFAFLLTLSLAVPAWAQRSILTLSCDCDGFMLKLDGEQRYFRNGFGATNPSGEFMMTRSARIEDLGPGRHEVQVEVLSSPFTSDVWYKGFIDIPAGTEVRARVTQGTLEVYSRTPLAAPPPAPVVVSPPPVAPAGQVTVSVNAGTGPGTVTASVSVPSSQAPAFAAPAAAEAEGPGSLELVVEDRQWCNVWIDGEQRAEIRGAYKASLAQLAPGEHRLVVKDFMNKKSLVEGTLYVRPGAALKAGVRVQQGRLEVYNDSGAFRLF